MSKTAFWYCENCKQEVDPINVTYQELHDTCGHPVEWIDLKPIGNDEEARKARETIENLKPIKNLEVKMNEYDVKRLAEVLAIQAEIEGMKAENRISMLEYEKNTYCEEDFYTKAEELRITASKHNEQI